MRTLITLILLMLATTAYSINYHSYGNNSWAGSGFPNPVAIGDTVFIDNSDIITTDANIVINGVVVINSDAELSGSHKITVSIGGNLHNDGIICIKPQEIHVDGSLYNSGTINAKKLHNDGYVCNSGTFIQEPNQTLDVHGGTIECCGTILADKVKFHDNGGTPASIGCQNFCNVDNDGNPTFTQGGGSDGVTEAEFLSNLDLIEVSISLINTVLCDPVTVVLPVELFDFNGYADERINVIHWKTSSEINNDYFLLEKSEDGIHWETVSKIKGVGNSTSIIRYEYVDEDPFIMTTYYRLSQVDFDGESKMFTDNANDNAIAIKNESDVFYTYSKSKDNNIYLSSPYYFEFYNMMGQKVRCGTSNVVETAGLPKGIYILKIEGGYTQKFFIR